MKNFHQLIITTLILHVVTNLKMPIVYFIDITYQNLILQMQYTIKLTITTISIVFLKNQHNKAPTLFCILNTTSLYAESHYSKKTTQTSPYTTNSRETFHSTSPTTFASPLPQQTSPQLPSQQQQFSFRNNVPTTQNQSPYYNRGVSR